MTCATALRQLRFLQKKDEGSMKGEKKGSQEDEEG